MELCDIKPIKQPRMAVAQIEKYPFFKVKDGEEVTIRFLNADVSPPPAYYHSISEKSSCPLCETPSSVENYVLLRETDDAGLPIDGYLKLKKSTYDKIVQSVEANSSENIFIKTWHFLRGLSTRLWCKITGTGSNIRRFILSQ